MRSAHRHHQPTTDRPCWACATALDHCHGTLVLHADGAAECNHADRCECREDLHELWVSCTDLSCGCTGDEHPLSQLQLAA